MIEKIGYSQLIDQFSLNVLDQPLRSYLGPGSTKSKELTPDYLKVHYPERFRTDGSWQGHLLFAIKVTAQPGTS